MPTAALTAELAVVLTMSDFSPHSPPVLHSRRSADPRSSLLSPQMPRRSTCPWIGSASPRRSSWSLPETFTHTGMAGSLVVRRVNCRGPGRRRAQGTVQTMIGGASLDRGCTWGLPILGTTSGEMHICYYSL